MNKNHIIVLLIIIFIAFILFQNNKSNFKSKVIRELEIQNKDYKQRDSIRVAKIASLQTYRDSIKQNRDTVFIYLKQTDENTSNEVARIDTTNSDSLLSELSRRYGIRIGTDGIN